jgi:hypothetical protein
MQFIPTRRWLSIFGCCLAVAVGSCSSRAADPIPSTPASAAEAGKSLDLAVFPLAAGAETPRLRTMAGLSYNAPGTVATVGEFQRKQLTATGWRDVSGEYAVSEWSANYTFTRGGYCLSVSVTPVGLVPAAKPGTVQVTILNHGNVRLDQLPVPPDAKPSFSSPAMAMFVTEAPVDKSVEACRKLLIASGWQPYGKAGNSLIFKQNAVRLTATVATAPAQGGKTMISYSTALMSVDLPAPTDTIDLQYADLTSTLSFDTSAAMADVASFYRTTLGKAGWEATTDKLIQIDSKDMMIFRNPQADMLTLTIYEVDSKNRVLLTHQSAAEIAELERKIKADAETKTKAKAAKGT